MKSKAVKKFSRIRMISNNFYKVVHFVPHTLDGSIQWILFHLYIIIFFIYFIIPTKTVLNVISSNDFEFA